MFASERNGEYQIGQNHMFCCGRRHKTADEAVGVIYAPGGGGLETSWQVASATNPNEVNEVIQQVTDRPGWTPGYRLTTFASNWTWGNDTVIQQISDLYAYSQSHHAFSSTKVHLLGVSMGTTCVLNWAKDNPTKVASIACLLPAVDIQDIEDHNRATAIPIPAPSTAYGNSRPPDNRTPARNGSSYLSIPVKLWYSTNDSICIPSAVTTFAAASGAELVSIGNQSGGAIAGHGLNQGFDTGSVIDYFDQH